MPELNPKKVPASDSAAPDPAAADSAAPDSAAEFDLVQPFLLESSGIRGDLVRLGPVAEHIIARHAYPGPLAA